MSLANKLHLVHATNGAPVGVADQAALSEERFTELASALRRLGAAPQATRLHLLDGNLVRHAGALAAALLPMVTDSEFVVTHAFEGGHPDHDACALALHLACERAALLKGHHPCRLEFAIYALQGDKIMANSFPADRARTVLVLTEAERQRKARALAAFRSQQAVIEQFPLREEQLRATPSHDFLKPRETQQTLFAAADPEQERRWRGAAAASLGGGNW